MMFVDAVGEFGQRLQLGELGRDFAAEGQVRLALPDELTLHLESADDCLLVYLAMPVPHVGNQDLMAALQLANLRGLADAQVCQVGLQGRGADARLVVLQRLRGHALPGTEIESAVERLRQWLATWTSTCRNQTGATR